MIVDIAVIIPTFNAVNFISCALESIANQTRQPKEVIIVDDNSSDLTIKTIEEVSQNLNLEVRVIALNKNHGAPAPGINIGIQNASAKYICILEQDDFFLPNKIEAALNILEQNNSIILTGSLSATITPAVDALAEEVKVNTWNPKVTAHAVKYQDGFLVNNASQLLVEEGMFLSGFTALTFRKADYLSVLGLNNKYKIAADFDFATRIVRHGSLFISSEVQYLRRIHGNNLSHNRIKSFFEDLEIRAQEEKSNPILKEKVLGFSYWLAEGAYLYNFISSFRLQILIATRPSCMLKNLIKGLVKIFLIKIGLREARFCGYTKAPYLHKHKK